jgi:hypothetical protein
MYAVFKRFRIVRIGGNSETVTFSACLVEGQKSLKRSTILSSPKADSNLKTTLPPHPCLRSKLHQLARCLLCMNLARLCSAFEMCLVLRPRLRSNRDSQEGLSTKGRVPGDSNTNRTATETRDPASP